jgi:hypothetical protein
MKVFTFGRALRLAMLGGAIYYVRKHGGLRSTWDQLVEKMKPIADQAKEKMEEVTQNVGQNLGGKQREGMETEAEIETGGVGAGEVGGSTSQQPYTGSAGGVGSGIPDFGDRGNKTGY